MRASLVMAGVAAGALALGGCNPARFGEHRNERPLVAAARLDCPERQGELSRTSLAPDGRSCTYTGDRGEDVTLELMALNAKPPQAALAELESQLRAAAPAAGTTSAQEESGAAAENTMDRDEDGDENTEINLPGLHVNAHGDRAHVSLPGVHVDADNGKAVVNVDKPGGRLVSIRADEDGAEIRTGEITARNVNSSYLLASKGGDDGGPAVGYVARGPVGGPLVVAVVKARGHEEDAHDLLHSVHRLVNRNVRRA